MNKSKAIKRLTKAIIDEADNNGFADFWDESWNPQAHVNITLTIDELRCAYYLMLPKKAPKWFVNPSIKLRK